MAIREGDRIPDTEFLRVGAEGIERVSSREVFGGKKVVLFAVPGAFTPTCSDTHLPGYQVAADKIKDKGVDEIVCVAVNDPFVVASWVQARNIGDDITVLSDGNGEFTEAVGMMKDFSVIGLGNRSTRYAAIVDDGVVRYLGVEPGREVGVSSAEAVLVQL